MRRSSKAARMTSNVVSINPRDISFPRPGYERWWHGGDPVASTIYNALSLSFPQGEAYFVRSVRHYLDELPEPLRSQVEAFAQQEAYHSREHMALNRQVSDAGYEIKEIEALIREDELKTRDLPPEVHVASTAALEHFTAMLAHALLADERHLRGCPDHIGRLWRWHSIEEIEHKAVAFDTLMYVTRDLSPLKRWWFRVMVMWQITLDFLKERKRDIGLLLRQDGLDTPRTWRKILIFLVLKPGLLRKILIPYLWYYLPGFHPWRHDDRALAASAENHLAFAAA